ncbi:MAG: RraA family protein [Bryobacterales bacterium]|nr:RraA family protein [Bryobacterales bacterium]
MKNLRTFGTGALSDALGKTGAMDHEIKCRSANPRMAGQAFTVRIHTADILMVGRALSECPAGKVLVIDGRGAPNTALWGDLTTLAARVKKLAGVVIDGAIRDMRRVQKDALPVFARSVVPNAGGAEYVGELSVPVSCGGVPVSPGDWVVGDEDGVVVIPAARLQEVVAKAKLIVAAERKIERALRAGADLSELLRFSERIERKKNEVFLPQLSSRPIRDSASVRRP